MNADKERHRRGVCARIAGAAYLVTIATGVFAQVYARGALLIAHDPLGTAAKLRAAESLYRWGIVSDCVMLIAYAVVTALLYQLFKPVSRAVSMTAALFSMLGLALLSAATGLLFVPLQIGDGAAAYDVLRLHDAFYGLTGVFFGAYCLLLGWLIWRSRAMPRIIGLLMGLAGAVFVLDETLALLAPAAAKAIPGAVMLVSLVGEGSLAVWLTAFGMRRGE